MPAPNIFVSGTWNVSEQFLHPHEGMGWAVFHTAMPLLSSWHRKHVESDIYFENLFYLEGRETKFLITGTFS